METRRFGPTGRAVPWLGQGTWKMEDDDRRGTIAALRRGFDLGMTHVDTAEMYGRGRVEELLAEAMASRRDELFIVSKVLPQNASYAGTIKACEQSLARLRTDRLDGYLLHWRGRHPLEDTLRAFEKLVADGKIVTYGVSNFGAADLDEAVAIAGPGRIACNQVSYHLDDRGIEHEDVAACERHGVSIVAYSPFGQGSFPSPSSRRGRVLGEIALAHGATPYQVALRFLARRPSVFVIPKASRVRHVEDNAAADALTLDADEIARIDAAFPLDGGRRRTSR